MSLVAALRALGPIDVRGIGRDRMLRWMIFLPLVCALALRWGVPPLTRRLLAVYRFDLVPYYPPLLAYFFVLMCPIIFGTLVGFLLLDEKDDGTLTALAVTPLRLSSYLAYRVAVPILLTVALMFALFPLTGLASFGAGMILATAVAAAPTAPMFALFLASQAHNKVQGFALMKLSGVVLFAPVVAYFVHSRWQLAFALVPTYWPMKVYWMLEAGEEGVWPVLAVGMAYQSLVTLVFARRFSSVLHR